MIHRNTTKLQTPDWQNTLSRSIKDPVELFEMLELPKKYLPNAQKAHQLFPLRATLPYLSRIKKGNMHDPLLKQILPIGEECHNTSGYQRDPVGDTLAEKLPGLIHKYHGRVLLTLTGACGIHCRYCFRRHFNYQASNPARNLWNSTVDYIAENESIHEVILSGGDPLSLSDNRLHDLISDLSQIPHLRFLRVHTRQPILLPERVTPKLLSAISDTRLKVIIVLHINHVQEIDNDVNNCISLIKTANVDLLNQSVLLKGVNDTAEILSELSLKLGEMGIFPYYLHMLDKVEGAAHFDVEDNRAQQIIESMRASLPGYLVPKLVREIAGESSKMPVF